MQLRAKSLGARDYLALLDALAPLAKEKGVPLLANDRPDLAWLAGCDGVHVGQSDLPVDAVRRFRRELLVGVSTHTEEQLEEAFSRTPSYVAVGPIYDTGSKENPEATVGLTLLERAHQLSIRNQIPLVAIGGIDIARAKIVGRWAEYVAVISALIPSDGKLATVTQLAADLHHAIGSA